MKRKKIGRPKIEKDTYPRARARLKRLFSLYIRKSRKGCEVHDRANQLGVTLPFTCGGVPQTCHKLPVARSRSVEFNERNVYRGCSGGNQWEQHNRDRWMTEVFPIIWPDDFQYLTIAAKIGNKKTLEDIHNMIVYYETKLSEFD